MHKTYLASIAVASLGLILYFPICLSITTFSILSLTAICIGVFAVIWVHILLSSAHKTGAMVEQVNHELDTFRSKLLNDYETNTKNLKHGTNYLPVVFGRTVDSLLQQLLDHILRDFVSIWLNPYAYECHLLIDNLKDDLWGAIQNLHDRMTRVDQAKLIACDMITKVTLHFEKIRTARTLIAESTRPPVFAISPHLISPEKELEYIRHVSELLIMFLLPRSYSLSPAKHLLREIISCKILEPLVDRLTDPDYINQKIIDYIEQQRITAAMHRKTYEYANTYEDFLKVIQDSEEMEVLKTIRFNIVAEMMQATTIQNQKRAKGIDPDQEKTTVSASGVAKSEWLAARKLKCYINQLSYAKSQCEKRLGALGWDGAFPHQDEINKMLPLSSILDHVLGRKYLTLFLETLASPGLVGYWLAVEELRGAHRSSWHQLGAEIFYTYIRSPSAEIKVDKNTRKRMEAFLLGDKGPEVFYEVQKNVLQTLEEKYYQPFGLSKFYKQMLAGMSTDETVVDHEGMGNMALEERQMSGDSSGSNDSAGMHVGDHSNYARRKLDQLQEKLSNKMQALQALRSSLKPESKVLTILEREVEWLQGEQRQLEAHLTRTEVWGENLGKWRAVVQSAEIPDEREPPQFVIVVHMVEDHSPDGEEGISTGWVVLRTLPQFQDLHRKLRPLCSGVKSLELPSQSFKFLFGKSDRNSLDKAKAQIQKYLEFVLEDDRLNQSEALYSFLSPSSDHLKHVTPSPKKSRFSLSTLFKSGSGEQSRGETIATLRENEEDDISQCLDAPGATDSTDLSRANMGMGKGVDDNKDDIAEPLYTLMSEVFDMRGLFKWLRKSLITFVQITYGRTINRQIRDTISWCFSESMLHYYITVLLKTWWPGGELAADGPERSEEMKSATAQLAREQFVENVPDILCTLVGAQNARRGASKVFETVQNRQLNKQLFYDLCEVMMCEVFPELKFHQ